MMNLELSINYLWGVKRIVILKFMYFIFGCGGLV